VAKYWLKTNRSKTSIMTRVRAYMEKHCEWERIQEVLIGHWKRDVNNTHVLLMDATCYESYIRFSTNFKLLWECCEWVFEKQLFRLCSHLGIKRPRSKYREQKIAQMAYSRKRKNTFRETLRRRKALVYLLGKGIGQLQQIRDSNKGADLGLKDFDRFAVVKKVHFQQEFLLDNPPSALKDRIVSIHKPYLRPIVRGKENRPVEFGAKAHILQVDGLTFIDKLDFNAFNECTRLKLSVAKNRRFFGPVNQLGADRIYATNKNRSYCTGIERSLKTQSKTASGDKCVHTINDPHIRWVKKKKLYFSVLKWNWKSSKKQREKENRA